MMRHYLSIRVLLVLFAAGGTLRAATKPHAGPAPEPNGTWTNTDLSRLGGAALSRNFAATGLRAGELLRDWQQHIAFTFQNGYPLSEVSIFFDRDRAADALGMAALAASDDADRAALQQLRNLFTSLEQWSDSLVEDKRNLRLARYYMSPTALEDDPVFQRNTECATSIAVMLSSKQLAEIPSCQ